MTDRTKIEKAAALCESLANETGANVLDVLHGLTGVAWDGDDAATIRARLDEGPAVIGPFPGDQTKMREALKEAREALEDWLLYVPEHFKQKHDADGDLRKIDEALAATEGDGRGLAAAREAELVAEVERTQEDLNAMVEKHAALSLEVERLREAGRTALAYLDGCEGLAVAVPIGMLRAAHARRSAGESSEVDRKAEAEGAW